MEIALRLRAVPRRASFPLDPGRSGRPESWGNAERVRRAAAARPLDNSEGVSCRPARTEPREADRRDGALPPYRLGCSPLYGRKGAARTKAGWALCPRAPPASAKRTLQAVPKPPCGPSTQRRRRQQQLRVSGAAIRPATATGRLTARRA